MVGVPALVEAMRQDERPGPVNAKSAGSWRRPIVARRLVPSVTEAPRQARVEMVEIFRAAGAE
jgi:predicted CoA-binding protein